ncbi:MAG TPA: TonB-dependent receptor [Ignavibacteria bacterium]
MKKGILKLIFLFLFFILSNELFAQAIIQGVVLDSITKAPMVGGIVHLRGTALGSNVDREGNYRITGVPAGTYTVRVSYIGYKNKELSVTVPQGSKEVIKLNVLLSPDAVEGETIIVYGQQRGQQVAINQQISANTMVNVVSEEKIQELPDVNAAEVIGRMPGVSVQRSGGEANKIVLRGLSDKFGAITIDGVRIATTDANSRGVDLSTISQGSLAGIELYKALTPDKDADAIAGTVNLVTRKAPTERLIRVDAKGAYNQLNNTFKQYDFQARYGERFFNDILGVQFSGNIEQRDRSKENTDLDYNTNVDGKGSDYEITNFDLYFTEETRKRGGLNLLLDINTPDSGSIKISNIYNKTKRDYTIFSRNYPTVGSTDLIYQTRDREQEIETYNSSIKGENYLFGINASWGLSFAQSISEAPFDYSLDFREPPEVVNGEPISRMRAIPPEILKGPPEALIPYALNNFDKAYLNWGFFRGERNIEKERTAFADLSKRFTISTLISDELKFGGKYKIKNRSKQTSEMASPYYIDPFRKYYIASDGTVKQKNFAGTRFANLKLDGGKILLSNFLVNPEHRNVYDKYDLYPLITKDAIREWWRLNKDGVATSAGQDAEYKPNNEIAAECYDIIERVSSAYLMNTFNIGQFLTIIAGVRMEREENDYKAKYSPGPLTGFPTPLGTLKDTSATFTETNWFPNLQLTYRPFEFMNVRLAAYKALARPDFNYRIEKYVARIAGTGVPGVTNNVTLYVGNPRLKSATAWNYEVNTSFYTTDIGLITLSAFYKEITNMYHMLNGVPTTGDKLLDSLGIKWRSPFASGVQYALLFPYNSDKPTKVWGFELEHQANMTFLPGLLQYLVLGYNFSIVRSETHIINSRIDKETIPYFPFTRLKVVLFDQKQKLEGQPEFFGNAQIGYDIAGFSARLSVFYQGKFNTGFSFDSRNDQEQGSFTKWDFVVKQKVTDNVSLMLNINNFSSVEEEGFLKNNFTGWRILDGSEKYGMTIDFGVRVTL